MHLVNIHEAKTQLSKLLEQVQAGEDIVIAKAGAPIVRLIPYTPPRRRIAPLGAMEGEGWIAEDFDEPIDEHFNCLKDHAE
ncbi:MAG: type II toxin-antitoxin system prevent-host-death family antitoxin [Sulfurimicrobium sp.]|nr:type II toxin-antitoxin system prevent-host-death family antitoxin [Sulfurimicrobium sp.]MDP1705204.1 type II toxin-antitoxin system prevent-host-death family antitoxin [Sulfurimicrobium sp.]MDP2200292.1 type II toxin-antitoxin system prevent-host-death family antitoxin [Sulfurimicrobium sp.]MDP3687401.1 type II toxin-antitoxin system prevent-host-death family antitoxin [Sulfurimicrobium sp.]